MKANNDFELPGGRRLNRRQAAEYLGVTFGTLTKWASVTGCPVIPYHMIGGKAVYFQDDLDKVIADGRIE